MQLHRYKTFESVLKFNDGVNIDTSGKLRKLELSDGWYVVGEGRCIPCKDESEANSILDSMEKIIYKKVDQDYQKKMQDWLNK
jgi:hypothetical protein